MKLKNTCWVSHIWVLDTIFSIKLLNSDIISRYKNLMEKIWIQRNLPIKGKKYDMKKWSMGFEYCAHNGIGSLNSWWTECQSLNL